MTDSLLIFSLMLNVLIIILLLVCIIRNPQKRLAKIESYLEQNEKILERSERINREEMAKNREEAARSARSIREETGSSLQAFNDALLSRMMEIAAMQRSQLEGFAAQLNSMIDLNDKRLGQIRATVEERLTSLQTDNSQKLEQMRVTVDEKLNSTLETRLGESFKLVSDRLELVHRGLGEMQSLATGVGDLKRVLGNVKTRGIWGEIQLRNILDDILTREQYAENVTTKKGSAERVEFAVKLPGRNDDGQVWLPIDAKFPQEDYQRLMDAIEQGNLTLAEEAVRQLETRIKTDAKSIKEKYLDPPHTTDFAIMFLPVEGLYAEVLRRPGLCDYLQREYRVAITGPTTLAAFLNSLQMGFRTMTIEKRSSEVWTLLAAVKNEFGKFGTILEKTQKKLHEASATIEDAAKKSRTIEKKLNKVQQLPETNEAAVMLDYDEEAASEE
ncbi:MAG: DNA recombination protein RmuC [Ignavibacteriales bacterium]